MLWYLAVLVFNSIKSVSKSLKFCPKWQYLYFKPFLAAFFVTMSPVKLNKCQHFTLGLFFYKPVRRNWWTAKFSFWLQRGQISPLMHVPLRYIRIHVLNQDSNMHTQQFYMYQDKRDFPSFSTKLYVMGTQKNRLNETVLLSTQNTCLSWWVKKYKCSYKYNFTLKNLIYICKQWMLWWDCAYAHARRSLGC